MHYRHHYFAVAPLLALTCGANSLYAQEPESVQEETPAATQAAPTNDSPLPESAPQGDSPPTETTKTPPEGTAAALPPESRPSQKESATDSSSPTAPSAAASKQPAASAVDHAKLLARIEALEAKLHEREVNEKQAAEALKKDDLASAVNPRSSRNPVRENPLDRLEEPGFAKSTPLFGSDFRFGIGGYVKVDALYDFDSNLDRTQFLLAGIPIEDSPESNDKGYFNMFARETRFNFDLRYMKEGVPFNQAFIELDFFGVTAGGTTIPRLRHAYLRWDNLLAGQTWSLLTDLGALPFMIDFAYGDALLGGRTTQVRWEQSLGEHFEYRVGFEMPESGGIENPLGYPGLARVQLPRFAARGKVKGKRGFFALGGSISQLYWDGESQVENAHAPAWAAVAAGRYYFDEAQTAAVMGHASMGRGSGEMIISFAGQEASGTLIDNEVLETMLSWNASIAYSQRWAEPLSTNLAFAWARLQPTELRADDRMQMGWAAHINAIWHISKPLQAGIEYIVGERVNVSEEKGLGQRVQSMIMYTF